MEGNTSISGFDKHNLRCLYRVVVVKLEVQTERLAVVNWVLVKNPDIHLPLCEVVGADEGDA